ncbi:hypothetical protein BDC45DRAFT_541783 [Circinella umbellata]|nr:hypothetical protein BDC45DRAFT_541783 [Circinella umbellata]
MTWFIIKVDEIDNEQQLSIAELPNIITEYLNSYKDLAHNAVQTILEILMLGLQKEFKTEADLMKRVWVIINNCFDYSAINAISGEYLSKASSARTNMDRSLAVISRKKNLFGTVEAGKISDVNSTKTLYEVHMKLLKNLKDIQYDLIQEWDSVLNN